MVIGAGICLSYGLSDFAVVREYGTQNSCCVWLIDYLTPFSVACATGYKVYDRNIIPCSLSDEMKSKYAGVKAAIIKAHHADVHESMGDFSSALECYQSAVELLLPLIEGIFDEQ
jgi:hypothetical protein